MEVLDGLHPGQDGILNPEDLNIAVAERTVKLSIAEERATFALQACQEQVLADECSKHRLLHLGDRLDSLISAYGMKFKGQSGDGSGDDVAMRSLARLHSQTEILGSARKAVQVVHQWKAATASIYGRRPAQPKHTESHLQHIKDLWALFHQAAQHRQQLVELDCTRSIAFASSLAFIDSGVEKSLEACLSSCVDAIVQPSSPPPSNLLQQLVAMAPPGSQPAVLRATVATFANAKHSGETGTAASEAYLVLPAELLDDFAVHWAVVACARPSGMLTFSKEPRSWQQALAGATASPEHCEEMSLETARRQLQSNLDNSGVSLPGTSGLPVSLKLGSQVMQAVAAVLRAEADSTTKLQALQELCSMVDDVAADFERMLAQCIATAVLLLRTQQREQAAASLVDAAVLAAVNATASIQDLIRVQWLGASLLAAAAGLGVDGGQAVGGGGGGTCQRALGLIGPLANFTQSGGAKAWMKSARAFGIDSSASIVAVQHQLQGILQSCSAEAEMGCQANSARSRVTSDATDIFADDDASSQGTVDAEEHSGSLQRRVLFCLLLGTCATQLLSEIQDAHTVTTSEMQRTGSDISSVLQTVVFDLVPAGAPSEEVAECAAHVQSAHSPAVRALLLPIATEMTQGTPASSAPAATSNHFSTSLEEDAISLLWACVDALLMPAMSALAPSAGGSSSEDTLGSMYSLQPSASVIDACHALMQLLQTCSPAVMLPALRAVAVGGRPGQATLSACLSFLETAQKSQWQMGSWQAGAADAEAVSSPALSRALGVAHNESTGTQLSASEEASAFAGLVVYCCGERFQARLVSWLRDQAMSKAQREVDVEHLESFLASVGLQANPNLLQCAEASPSA